MALVPPHPSQPLHSAHCPASPGRFLCSNYAARWSGQGDPTSTHIKPQSTQPTLTHISPPPSVPGCSSATTTHTANFGQGDPTSTHIDSPEKILTKIHITRKVLEMESRIAVAVSVLPWVHHVDLHDQGIISCCDVVVHVLTAK